MLTKQTTGKSWTERHSQLPRVLSGSVATVLFLALATFLYAQSSPLTVQPSTGRVGIGTTNPSSTLHVNGDIQWGTNSYLLATQGGSIELGGNNSTPGVGTPYIDFHYAGIAQDYNARIINDVNGRLTLVAPTVLSYGKFNVDIGSTANEGISLLDSLGRQIKLVSNTGAGSYSPLMQAGDFGLIFWGETGGSGSLVLGQWNASAKGMRINPDGNIGIGISTADYLLHVNGTAGKPGGGSWASASDGRLKTNIQDLRGTLDKLLHLRGVSFEYKDAASISELPGTQIGLIAQEVEEVFPQWVDEGTDGFKRVTYRGFEALAVEAIRELRDVVKEQQSQIGELKMEIDKLLGKTRLATSTQSAAQ